VAFGLAARTSSVRSGRWRRFFPVPILAKTGLLDLVDQRFDCDCQCRVTCPNGRSKVLRIVSIRSGTDKQPVCIPRMSFLGQVLMRLRSERAVAGPRQPPAQPRFRRQFRHQAQPQSHCRTSLCDFPCGVPNGFASNRRRRTSRGIVDRAGDHKAYRSLIAR
jgi:hypothetical protein